MDREHVAELRLYAGCWLTIIMLLLSVAVSAQTYNAVGEGFAIKPKPFQDTSKMKKQLEVVQAEVPDTNFTYEKYAAFLKAVSDTSRFIVLPLNEFRTTTNPSKIVIGLRHDVDLDLNLANAFSQTETGLGFRSTYYILHTAPYYLATPGDVAHHTDKIIPILRDMQDIGRHEIGWHNDLVTLQAVYNMDPVAFLHNELLWLRSNGINIYGTASHGSNYCYTYKYLNFYFFEECTWPVVGQFVNNVNLPMGSTWVPMKKGKLSDFGLEYEAYFLNNNKYFSDASVTNGIRWNLSMLDMSKLVPGDRVIILLHPVHWHKANTGTAIESFSIPGQISSKIDLLNHTVTVVMPSLTDRHLLKPNFVLSPGALAKVAGKMQSSGITANDYTWPVTFTVYAENREIRKEWTIIVTNVKSDACNFESFLVSGLTSSVRINHNDRTISVEVDEDADLAHLQVQFQLSPGAIAWIGRVEQFSNNGTVDFTKAVEYKVVAEDGVSTCNWLVKVTRKTVGLLDSVQANQLFSVYPNPSKGQVKINFRDVPESPSVLSVYNTRGEIIRTEHIEKTGSFNVELDLFRFPSGFYIFKYSLAEKPVKILLRK